MQKRNELWWMILFQLICNTFVTLSMDIAILSMTERPPTKATDGQPANQQIVLCPNETFFVKDFSIMDSLTSSTSTPQMRRFHWSKFEQSIVLSSYFWFNYFAILPGGIMAQKYGSKLIGGYSQLISSAMSSLIPVVAVYGPWKLAWLRAIQGFLSHVSMPGSVTTIMGRWCPPQERGRCGALYFAGSLIGTTLGSFLFGYFAQYLNWTYVFHLTSVCGVVWAVLWYLLVHDSPSQHPTITMQEKEYILDSLKKATICAKTDIPWKSIISSVPVIVTALAENSGVWLWVLTIVYGPIYLQTIYGLESHAIGVITGVPNIGSGVLIFATAYGMDFIMAKSPLSFTNTRKAVACTGCILVSIATLTIAFTKCNLTVVITCVVIQIAVRPLLVFGPTLSILDMSPAFCGIIQGFAHTSSATQTFVFVWAVNYLTKHLDIEMVWKVVFSCSTLYFISAHALYFIFGTSQVLKWNFIESVDQSKSKNVQDENNETTSHM